MRNQEQKKTKVEKRKTIKAKMCLHPVVLSYDPFNNTNMANAFQQHLLIVTLVPEAKAFFLNLFS